MKFQKSVRSAGGEQSPLQNKYVGKMEYISIALLRIGSMFSTTLTGTLAVAFYHELYFGPVGLDAKEVADVNAVQTTITTIAGILCGLLSSMLVQKWKTKFGRYRMWFSLIALPLFTVNVLYFYIPKGWDVKNMMYLRYGIALAQCIINAFFNLSQNIVHVISPDPKEKKFIATCWQLFYYIGYGAAYGATFIYGLFSSNKEAMYMRLTVVASAVQLLGVAMVGTFCQERIELSVKKEKRVFKDLFILFKDRNYRSYQYMQWINIFANLGRFSTYLAAITVGSSKNLLLTLPTAVGTVVGNLITAKISKKYEPTKLLRFCGVYSMCSASLIFLTCFIESRFGIYFFSGTISILFYVFYFLFGVGIGVQELSNSHFVVEFYDYLEWKTGKRMEAVQGVIPGWINTGLTYAKDMLIPYMLAWTGYLASEEGDLVKTMQAQPTYLNTCLWLLAFLVFGYALATFGKAVLLKFLYNVEGETKKTMYKELAEIRQRVHTDNEATAQ